VKFTIPEPVTAYPPLPFSLNVKAEVKIDSSGMLLYVNFGSPETPLHPAAMDHQAATAWDTFPPDSPYVVWPAWTL
jgi:hypothetical protein